MSDRERRFFYGLAIMAAVVLVVGAIWAQAWSLILVAVIAAALVIGLRRRARR